MSKGADSQVQSVLKSLIGMHSQIKTYYNFLNKPIQKNSISAFFCHQISNFRVHKNGMKHVFKMHIPGFNPEIATRCL